MKCKFLSRLLATAMTLSLIGNVPNSVKAEGILSDYGKCDGNVTASTTVGGGANEYYQEYNLTITNSGDETVNDWMAVVKTPENINSLSNESADWNAVNYYMDGDSIYVYPVRDKSIAAGSSQQYVSLGYSGKAYTSIDVYYSSTAGAFDEYKSSNGAGSGSSAKVDEIVNADVEFNYAKLLQESLYFYDANMCGDKVGERSAFAWRDDCHTGDLVMIDGQKVDVTGGFHDAGDHVKFGLPGGYTATILGISYMEFKEAFTDTKSAGHYKVIADHFAEYFKKCTVLNKDGSVKCFIYQVGEGNSDHGVWTAPENQNGERQVYYTADDNPATDQVSEAIAALTLHYMNFGDKTSLEYAKKLFAYEKGMSKAVETKGAGSFYASSDWKDDYCLAAALLYKATKDSVYSTEFNQYKGGLNIYSWLSWDDVGALADYYGTGSADSLKSCANNMKVSDNGYSCLLEWGSARYNCNTQLLGLLYDKASSQNIFGTWATNQMNYILGNNKINTNGQCFVVGYNALSAKYPHHRAASASGDAGQYSDNHHILLGALVGGPVNSSGTYQDKQEDYKANEVALDYNAGFVGAAAALYLLHKGDSDVSKTLMTTDDVKNVELRFNYSVIDSPEPTSEEPTSEEPSSEQPSSEEPASEEPTSEEPASEQPTSEEPASEEPTSEEPASEQPTSEEPASEEPTSEEPSSEQPSSEEPASEEPTSEEPSSEQPSSEENSSENNTEEQKDTTDNTESNTAENTTENTADKTTENTTENTAEKTTENSTVVTDNKKDNATPASGKPAEQKKEVKTENKTETKTEAKTESQKNDSNNDATEAAKTEKNLGAGIGTLSADGTVLTDSTGKTYYVINKVTAAQLKKNLTVADKKSGGKYKITKVVKKNGKVISGNVTYMAPYNKNTTKMTAPKAVKIGGVKFFVTALNKNAFKDCKNLKSATIEINVTSIGANAFCGCKKLKSVNIRSKQIKKIGSNAFKGINGKATIKVPKIKLEKYTKQISKAKAPKTVTVK